ncbi:hypothetical protein [Rufibacter roseus]|uniref:Uncharacterized protein n=1 Tax=Rufibacter roseus TaxID=1567108 RepID=A0ABW2DMT8_9BACT|nr:hypothetical protein [Rufibacter roseus]
MNRPFFLLLFYLLASSGTWVRAWGQQVSGDSAFYATAVNHALNQLSPTKKKLYNGYEYLGFKFDVKRGHPFFKSSTWSVGEVQFDGIKYSNIKLLYDLVQDELVIEHLNRTSSLALTKAKVDSFQLLGHTFIYLEPTYATPTGFQSGFYDLLFSKNEIKVLGRYMKTVDGIIPEDKSVAYFPERNRFYIQKGEQIFLIKNKRDVLKVFPDKKKEVNELMGRLDLSVSKDPVDALVEVAKFYSEQL